MNPHAGEWRDWLTDCQPDEGGWAGRAFVPAWQAELVIRVDARDGQEPSPDQLVTLAELLRRDDGLRAEVGDRLFAYYKESAEGVATAFDPVTGTWGPDPDAPPVADPAHIWPLVCNPEVWVDDRSWRPGTGFVIAFECRWDREHGVGVRVEGWRVTDVGGAAEV